MNNWKKGLHTKVFCIAFLSSFAALIISSVCAAGSVDLTTAFLGAPADGDAGSSTPASFIHINAELPGTGTILFDKNGCGNPDRFGEPAFCTLVGYFPIKVDFVKMKVKDKTGKGRRLYKISGKLPNPSWEYYLVEPANSCGTYRLIIEEETASSTGKQKRRVITLEARQK